jgi:hypothetical protein
MNTLAMRDLGFARFSAPSRIRPSPKIGTETPGGFGIPFLAKTLGLGFVARLDWRLIAPVRVCAHSVDRP